MIVAVSFYFLYGMLTLCGLFLAPFWLNKAMRRATTLETHLKRDRYFWITLSLGLMASGMLVLGAARTWSYMQHGLTPTLYRPEGMFIFTGLLLMVVSLYIKIWLADLEQERHMWLRSSFFIGALWFVFCIFFVTGALK